MPWSFDFLHDHTTFCFFPVSRNLCPEHMKNYLSDRRSHQLCWGLSGNCYKSEQISAHDDWVRNSWLSVLLHLALLNASSLSATKTLILKWNKKKNIENTGGCNSYRYFWGCCCSSSNVRKENFPPNFPSPPLFFFTRNCYVWYL